MEPTDGMKVIYKLETELTKATNQNKGESNIEIKNAMVVLAADSGTYLIAPRVVSGQQVELYKPVDLFVANKADTSGLWYQADEATSVFAYVSPKFGDTKLVGAILTLPNSDTDSNNSNGVDMDAWAVRAVHDSGDLYIAAGAVGVAKEQLPTNDDYLRTMVSASYKMGDLTVGGGWESNSKHPSGDADITQVNITYQMNDKLSTSVGYIKRDHSVDANDDSGVLAIVKNQMTPNVFTFAEVAQFDTKKDNVNLGISVSF